MTSNYLEFLDQQLQDPTFALGYLNEGMHDEEPKTFLVVLGDILRCQGKSVAQVAKATGISREHLHRMLSLKGNPTFTTILALLDALDFELSVQPKKATQPKKAVKKKTRSPSSGPKRNSSRPSASP
ncbi:MAG: addiction module antidote protein [Parachlamydiales bacterium]